MRLFTSLYGNGILGHLEARDSNHGRISKFEGSNNSDDTFTKPARDATYHQHLLPKNLYNPHPTVIERSRCPSSNYVAREADFPDDLKAQLRSQGLASPTPIQAQGWPITLSGRNMIGIASTGSATPGKMIEFLETRKINLWRCIYIVLEEAERMLDMGFERQIKKIVQQINSEIKF
ncbi:hypothetical protein QYM36_005339 [Artemia franciscana]|uniref:DEAD/DEAH-box helicase domain-containing protein n=1 Tax=Artemia franciscana TaxID=6661 RepID=A0AA88L7J2_ARTSF|nr:hypothetical protein QYM36_005339 [Artemia franciscana]